MYFKNDIILLDLKGPFIVVVRDDKGHVFGGFCDAMLQNESTGFFGSQACFLFTFKPTTNVYRATEANTHYAYFHFSLSELDQQHQYSGFGMGGQKVTRKHCLHFVRAFLHLELTRISKLDKVTRDWQHLAVPVWPMMRNLILTRWKCLDLIVCKSKAVTVCWEKLRKRNDKQPNIWPSLWVKYNKPIIAKMALLQKLALDCRCYAIL